jgi:hypothetical protein
MNYYLETVGRILAKISLRAVIILMDICIQPNLTTTVLLGYILKKLLLLRQT